MSYKLFKMATESLIPDQSLINPKFEGYKLPPDQLTVQTTNLVSDVKVCKPRDDLFSLQYIRAFGSFNHLVLDRWQTTHERLYFVDENNEVQQVTVKVCIPMCNMEKKLYLLFQKLR